MRKLFLLAFSFGVFVSFGSDSEHTSILPEVDSESDSPEEINYRLVVAEETVNTVRELSGRIGLEANREQYSRGMKALQEMLPELVKYRGTEIPDLYVTKAFEKTYGVKPTPEQFQVAREAFEKGRESLEERFRKPTSQNLGEKASKTSLQGEETNSGNTVDAAGYNDPTVIVTSSILKTTEASTGKAIETKQTAAGGVGPVSPTKLDNMLLKSGPALSNNAYGGSSPKWTDSYSGQSDAIAKPLDGIAKSSNFSTEFAGPELGKTNANVTAAKSGGPNLGVKRLLSEALLNSMAGSALTGGSSVTPEQSGTAMSVGGGESINYYSFYTGTTPDYYGLNLLNSLSDSEVKDPLLEVENKSSSGRIPTAVLGAGSGTLGATSSFPSIQSSGGSAQQGGSVGVKNGTLDLKSTAGGANPTAIGKPEIVRTLGKIFGDVKAQLKFSEGTSLREPSGAVDFESNTLLSASLLKVEGTWKSLFGEPAATDALSKENEAGSSSDLPLYIGCLFALASIVIAGERYRRRLHAQAAMVHRNSENSEKSQDTKRWA